INGWTDTTSVHKLLDWEDNKDHYIMVMEWPMPCIDFKSFVTLHGESIDEETARKVMRQVIEAANVCIKHGDFHWDIKIENLQVKLIAFRIASFIVNMLKLTKSLFPRDKRILTTRVHHERQIHCKANNCLVTRDPPFHDGVRILSHRPRAGSDQLEEMYQTGPSKKNNLFYKS
ncbi:hypothetical protein cypCar_00017393, partial [Cyprinus carpio]